MSVTIEYFFNYPKNLAELTEDLNACLGCTLAPYEGRADDLFDRFLSMEFSLGLAHDFADGFVNDDEPGSEHFTYILDFRTPAGEGNARPIQIPAMLTIVYALHRWLGITGILVYDTQLLLARYEERDLPDHGRRLYDRVSDTTFVSFADHLERIIQRLPEQWRAQYC